MTTWIVDVERDAGQFIAQVRDLPSAHTFGADFDELDAAVREVIALVLDLPEGERDLDIAYAFPVPA
jgi:predicted RNase H-like HicB family nuclease